MKSIRNASNNIFVKVILVLLSLTFISWGASSAFVGNTQNEVINVNGEPIYLSEVYQDYQQRLNQVRRSIGGEITPEIEEALDIRQSVINNLVTEKILEQEAERLELRAAPTQMQDVILANPNFSDASGNFSRDVYADNLRRVGFTVNSYENLLRRQILFSNLSSLFTSQLKDEVTLSGFENYARKTANISILHIDHKALKNTPKPTTSDIRSFYENNKSTLVTNETRSFTILNISAKELLDTITVTDDEITEIYDTNKQDYTVEERREVRHILTQSEASAKQAAKRISAGESFASVAKELSQDFLSKNNGGALGLLEKSDMIDGIANDTFSLELNTLSAPIQSDLGYHIVEVLSIEAPRLQELKEVRKEIEADAKLTKAEDIYYNLLDKIEDGIDAGLSLTEISEDSNIKVSSYENVTINDASIAALTDARNAAFTQKKGEISAPIDVEGAEAVTFVQTTSITPSRAKTLEEASAEILAQLSKIQTEEALQDQATKLIEQLQNGSTLAQLSRRHGLTLEKVDAINRSAENAPNWLQRFHLANIFKLRKGESLNYPVTTDNGFALVSLLSFNQADWNAAQSNAFNDRIRSQIGEDLLSQFAGHMRQQANIEIKQTVIDNLLNGVYTERAPY